MREITFLHYYNYIHFLLVAPWQYHVGRCIQRLGLMEKNHIFSKFENMCIKMQPVWGLICVCFEKVKCVETYESKMLLGTS